MTGARPDQPIACAVSWLPTAAPATSSLACRQPGAPIPATLWPTSTDRTERVMGIDTHIKFDGIDGESVHKDHKGGI